MEHMRKIGMVIFVIIGVVLGYMIVQRYQQQHQQQNVKIQAKRTSCSSTNPCPSGYNCNYAPAYGSTGSCYKTGSAQPA